METYSTGDTVVVNHFGKNKVGTITERQKTVKGYRYLVKTEDGRDIEDLYVDDNNYTSTIDSRLTKSFVKHQNGTNKLMDDAIEIVNNN
jgi:hypothetical protein|tara:strand:+ start:832 stop:1098 length:267 start_codon:yes stop_codon:yes gene_type:complete